MKKIIFSLMLAASCMALPAQASGTDQTDNDSTVKAQIDSLQQAAKQMELMADSIEREWESSREASQDEKAEETEDWNTNVTGPTMLDEIADGLNAMPFGVTAIAITAIVAVFGLPIIFLGIIAYLIYKTRRQRYRVIEKAIDSGQPLPKELMSENQISDEEQKKNGIKNCFIGIGLVLFFKTLGFSGLEAIGYLVACYGVGQICIAYFTGRKAERDNAGDSHSTFNNKENTPT